MEDRQKKTRHRGEGEILQLLLTGKRENVNGLK